MHHAGCPTSPAIYNKTINTYNLELCDDGTLTIHEVGTTGTVVLSAAVVAAIHEFVQQPEFQEHVARTATRQ